MQDRIVYTCPFVPAEWIAAHDLTPSRVMPRSALDASALPVPGMCPYARAFVNAAVREPGAAAVVFTTICDQMRRAADMAPQITGLPVFLLNIPHTWQTGSSFELYLSELRRMGRFLVSLGGRDPSASELAEVMQQYDAERATAGSARGRAPGDAIPIALVGGPMTADHFGVFDLVEQAGGRVALDATESGERTVVGPFDWNRLGDDPLLLLARAYFDGITDPFRRPNTPFYNWLAQRIAERGIRGIILRRYLWCDTWHAEAERIKQHLGLPFLHLDVGDSPTDEARTLSRLQTFMEVLK